ncbi:MAG: helix-turn-helix transcriptional regulator [Terriglobales bacterium]
MRAHRLLAILLRLQVRGRLTAAELARQLEVSVRTIYRDVDELSAAGVPVRGDRGPAGGFELTGGYETRLTGLTANEAETMLLAGLAGPAADLGLGGPLGMARLKLLAALPAAARRAAQRVGDRIHLDPEPWYRREPPPPHLRAIAAALWARQRITVRYQSWSALVRRTLDPLGLVVKAGAWYLVARDAGRGIRTYKVGHVLSLRRLRAAFDEPPGFDLAKHWRTERARFEASLHQGEAQVRASSAASSRLEWLGSEAAERIRHGVLDGDGWRRATIPIESIGHSGSLLLSFGADIEVLSPPGLRRELAARAAQVRDLYRSDGPSGVRRRSR